ncbi:MAG: tail fiber domain-containing protein [Candidatus Udaeobacter sp.]
MKFQNVIQISIVIVCLGLLSRAHAVVPAPDGGYPGGNTAEGQNALLTLTTGGYNTAVGFLSLRSTSTGQLNTAIGAGALLSNTIGSFNTASGAFALLLNTTGSDNTAVGESALFNNTTGIHNTASGLQALLSNTTGNDNTANGVNTLASNTVGSHNAATGFGALQNNTTGASNVANGENALDSNTTGSFNTAIGLLAGSAQTIGSGNVYVGAGMAGVPGESDACYIRGVFGSTSASGIPVLVNANSKLGTTTSSKRFKEEIKPMDKASEAVFALKPVAFRYKKEIDPARTSQFGLVAEDVEKVNPNLVVRDKEGKPYSVRYDQVNAMLLNEFLKEHRKVEELTKDFQVTVAQLTARLDDQAAQIQRVSAQLEASKPAPQVVNSP